jgi:DNA-binding NarL/FixJ family response regulator
MNDTELTILLVDDHPLFVDGMRLVLAQYATTVRLLAAHDCASAQTMATTCSDIDLVLLDVKLPGASGMSCLTSFRGNFPLLPVIMLSANEDPEVVQRALRHGAQGYIPKSSTTEVMLNAVRLVLGGGVYVPAQALSGDYQRSRGLLAGACASSAPADLTRRQQDVLQLLAAGQSNKEIARALHVADGTVRAHVTAILRALGAANRTQAGMRATRLGLVLNDAP